MHIYSSYLKGAVGSAGLSNLRDVSLSVRRTQIDCGDVGVADDFVEPRPIRWRPDVALGKRAVDGGDGYKLIGHDAQEREREEEEDGEREDREQEEEEDED